MSLNINVATANETGYVGTQNQSQEKNSTYVGNFAKGQSETVTILAQKKGFAQKQAMKIIGDAWSKDKTSAQAVTDMEQARADKIAELRDWNDKLRDIDKNKATLQEEYGVASDSQEQKDLELLEKFQNYKGGSTEEAFSKEEIDRLGELQEMPRTEYQKKVLQQNASTATIKSEMSIIESKIVGLKQSATDTKIDQLKSQDMVKAEAASDSIMDAASQEALGILLQDAIDKAEEKQQEEEKKAEEAAEKKEEQQQKLEDAKEDTKAQDEILKNAAKENQLDRNTAAEKQTTSSMEVAQSQIQQILKENNLTNEDLKGIQIDFNF